MVPLRTATGIGRTCPLTQSRRVVRTIWVAVSIDDVSLRAPEILLRFVLMRCLLLFLPQSGEALGFLRSRRVGAVYHVGALTADKQASASDKAQKLNVLHTITIQQTPPLR